MTWDTIRDAVLAVEDNYRINNAKWLDWRDALDIGEVYEIDLDEDDRHILERAIETNGASLEADLRAFEEYREDWRNSEPLGHRFSDGLSASERHANPK